MSGSVAESRRRKYYTAQIARLEEELAAVESDLGSALSEADRVRLKRRAEQLLDEIEDCEQKLEELDSQSSSQNIKENNLEKIFYKIDFKQAKQTASRIKNELNEDGGAVLFFLQKSKKQMGDYCVEEVINVIMGDQIIDGQIMGAYRRYSVDLGSAISQYNESEFLIRLASYFNVSISDDIKELSQQLKDNILKSIDAGNTIFLEIKSIDDLLEQEAFLAWFIDQFWKPLIDDLKVVSKTYKSKFIVALIADSQILDDCSSDYFCDGSVFDCYKMLELSVPNWTMDDIYEWLIPFRTLSRRMKDWSDQELKTFAKRLYRDSDGTPESVCVSLRKEFL